MTVYLINGEILVFSWLTTPAVKTAEVNVKLTIIYWKRTLITANH